MDDNPVITANSLHLTSSEDLSRTMTQDGEMVGDRCGELVSDYVEIINGKRLSWTNHLRLKRLLGSGGQGVVYLTERRGADDFTLPVALKILLL